MDFYDIATPEGHLEITKVYKDGRREIVYSEYNLITVGLGISLTELFAAAIDESNPDASMLTNYQLTLFQAGTGGDGVTPLSGITSLGTALTGPQYGTSPDLTVKTDGDLWQNGSVAAAAFCEIKSQGITKTGNTSVSYRFTLGTESANGVSIDELGLFSFDPFRRFYVPGNDRTASLLCAYRKFPEISKSNSFALTFKWTITF